MVCDHQYSIDSAPVQFLARAISELDSEDKKHFLMFLTGSPKLPIGGFKNLVPKFTVVRKDSPDQAADSLLPSVMTCMNYFKLPAYSSYEITQDRLLFAVREGLSSFHFS
jgi:E3 ubiquitin-protein ligase TRIP12